MSRIEDSFRLRRSIERGEPQPTARYLEEGMSDTPLTDAEMCDGWSGDAFAVSVEFARSLEKQNKILMLKANASLANNLCPDHRDKQNGKPCLACEIERIEKQLAERDAALARCVEALRELRIVAHTAGGIPLKAMFDDLLAALPTSAQATAKVLAAARRLVERGFAYTSDFRDLEEAIREEHGK